ncbi:hypothetical protein ABIE51_001722 [Lysobacter sp. OAE881]|uniref:hypothetical protein n=1 Tax=Lysobacter sp. OAE881 TaxID=2663813 RepID=UPI00178ACFBD
MPGYFMHPNPGEGIHADPPERPAVWLENGRAVVDEAIWLRYGPEGRALLQEEMERLNRQEAERVQAKANEPIFIPPRPAIPASSLERAARDLVKAGASLMTAGNALFAAIPNLAVIDEGAANGEANAE